MLSQTRLLDLITDLLGETERIHQPAGGLRSVRFDYVLEIQAGQKSCPKKQRDHELDRKYEERQPETL